MAIGQEEATKPSTSAHDWVCADGAALIERTEKLICAEGAVASPAAAQGMALAGRRSACLLLRLAEASPFPAQHASCVYHGWTGDPLPQPFAVVLLAASHQEAVDHCLAAHRIVQQTGSAVLCLLDKGWGEQPGLACLPSRDEIAAALDGASDASGRDDIRKAVQDAFQQVSKVTGRCCGPVQSQGDEDTQAVLVSTGSLALAAARAAQHFRSSGAAVGVLSVSQIRPFPHEELLERLRPHRQAVLLTAPGCELQATLRAGIKLLASKHASSGFPRSIPVALPDSEMSLLSLVQALERDCPQLGWSADLLRRLNGERQLRTPLRLGVTPGGRWGADLLLETAAQIAAEHDLPARIGWIAKSGLSMAALRLDWDPLDDRPIDGDEEQLDLLAITENHFVNPEPALQRLAPNAKLLLFASRPDPAQAWHLLPASRRRRLAEQKVHLAWLSSNSLSGPDPTGAPAEGIGRFLQGALLRLSASTDAEELPENSALPDAEAHWLRRGAEALRFVEPAELEGAVARQEVDFRPSIQLLRMPPAPADSDASAWKLPLRGFHVSGKGVASPEDPLPGLPLWPAVADAWPENGWRHRYPLWLEEPDGDSAKVRAVPLADLLQSALGGAQESGSPFSLLPDHLEGLVDEAAAQLGQNAAEPFSALLKRALQRYPDRFELSPQASQELAAELKRLGQELPQSGWLAGFGEEALLAFYAWSATAKRGPQARAMHRQVRRLVQELEDLLLADRSHRPDASQPDSLSASIGEGSAYIDAEALSGVLPPSRGSRPIEEERQKRIEDLLATLRGYLSQSVDSPPFHLIGSSSRAQQGPEGLEIPPLTSHPDAFGAAIGLFDGLMARAAEVFRALRMARLEVAGDYDPQLHDEVFARFEWQSLSADELLAVPPVVVLESAQHLTGMPLSSLGRLLRSGRPIQVLIADADPLMRFDPTDEDLTGYWPDFGYLAVAHREAFVLQSSLVEPQHLADGLQTLAAELRPSVALVAVPHLEDVAKPLPTEVLDWAWRLSQMAHAGRITPCFRYSPQAGGSWAERFDLDANPQPEKLHPEFSSQFAVRSSQAGAGSETKDSPSEPRTSPSPPPSQLPTANCELRTELTFAHAAALNPKYRPHFRVIPVEAWDDSEQTEIADYLERYAEAPPAAVPYIWVHDQQGVLQRAVMTREMAVACRDRRRSWRILQELAGVNNEYVRRAVDAVRQEVTAHAESRLQEEIEQARRAGAEEAIDRVVAALTSPDLLSGPVERAAPPPAKAAPVEQAPSPVVEEGEEAQEAPVEKPSPAKEEYEEPYIDSFLCTSCNDCIKVNPLLFVYNSDKQAEIGDSSAGSYAELVKAAEACPARCIHPGSPRPGDESATPEVLARAEPFR